MNLRSEMTGQAGVVILDGGLESLDILLSGIESTFATVVIDPARDGIDQIAAALDGAEEIERLHIISHGRPGALRLGATELSLESLEQDAGALARIAQALSSDADVVLYGCEAGAGERGAAFVTALAERLDARVAASSTKTGADALGGDWAFDIGAPVSGLALSAEAQAAYPGVLALINGNDGDNFIDRSNSGEFDTIQAGGGNDTILAGPLGAFITVDGNPNNGVNTIGFADTVVLNTGNDTVATFIVDITDGDVIRNFQAFDETTQDGDLFFLRFDGPGVTSIQSQTLEDQGDGTFDLLVTFAVEAGGTTIVRTQRFEDTVGTLVETGGAQGSGTDFRLLGNTLPVAADDTFSGEASETITGENVLDNDFDADADDISVTAVSGGAVGTQFALPSGALLTLNADGTFTYDPNGAFDDLGMGQSDTDTFSYTISDFGGDTDTATVTLTITNGNGDPVARDDDFSIDEDAPLSGNLFADNGNGADTDPDADTLAIVSINGVTANVGQEVALANGGAVTVNSNGDFGFVPGAEFVGTETFTYVVSDGNGGTESATVTITVNEVNDAPIAQADAINGTEDDSVTGNVLSDNGSGADTDPENDALTVTQVNGVDNSIGVDVTLGSGAVVNLSTNGQFTYTPAADFSGDDTFTYTVTDGTSTSTALVTVTVAEVNDAPRAEDDAFSFNRGVQAFNGDVAADNGNGADTDPEGDDITYTAIDTPDNGQLILENGGAFIYAPNAGFAGVDTFTYRATDEDGETDTATVTITVIDTESRYAIGGTPANISQFEGDIGETATITFDVSREGDLSESGTVDFVVTGTGGNAAAADDVLGGFPSNTLTFAPGETSKTIDVVVTGDLVPEANETFVVTLSNPTNANTNGTAIIENNADTAIGTIQNDDVATETGDDDKNKIKGSDDDDVIVAGEGDDKVKGGDGDDVILGGDGDDKLDGGEDDDIILGDDGDDKIKDKDGDDIIFGGDGDDDVRVKDGDNIIDLGAGDDTARAGKGDDIFVFKAGNEDDVIRKFGKNGRDQIDLSAFTDITFANLEDFVDQDGKDLEIEIGNDKIVLLKVDFDDDLNANDFIFAT